MLSSDAHHLIARIDLVEGDAAAVVPVEYKRGEPRSADDGPQAWPADRAQVCARCCNGTTWSRRRSCSRE